MRLHTQNVLTRTTYGHNVATDDRLRMMSEMVFFLTFSLSFFCRWCVRSYFDLISHLWVPWRRCDFFSISFLFFWFQANWVFSVCVCVCVFCSSASTNTKLCTAVIMAASVDGLTIGLNRKTTGREQKNVCIYFYVFINDCLQLYLGPTLSNWTRNFHRFSLSIPKTNKTQNNWSVSSNQQKKAIFFPLLVPSSLFFFIMREATRWNAYQFKNISWPSCLFI